MTDPEAHQFSPPAPTVPTDPAPSQLRPPHEALRRGLIVLDGAAGSDQLDVTHG